MEAFEKETIIRHDKESNVATVYTHEVRMISRLKNAGAVPIEEGKYEGTPYARFEVDKSWVKVTPPRKGKKGMPVGRKQDEAEQGESKKEVSE